MRPVRACLCADLPRLPTRTEVLILQHPRERRHPFGTARLLALSLASARLHTVHGGFARDLHCPIEVPAGAAVLYPHPLARDLAALPADELPKALIVLDGTWSNSKRLYRENPWLQQLPHVAIHPTAPSRYRIRKEPRPECLSTLEATVAALQRIEPETKGFEALLVAFDRMNERQIDEVRQRGHNGRIRRERQRPSRQLSPLLLSPNLLVAYAESSLPGGDPSRDRALVQWTAVRVATGETFEVMLRPQGPLPTAAHLQHMGLTAEQVANGGDLAAARARFAAFAGPGAVVAAWTPTTLQWGHAVLPDDCCSLSLKVNYSNLRGQRPGYLEDVVRREGLLLPEARCHGRAASRLANALALARWLVAVRAEQPVVRSAGAG